LAYCLDFDVGCGESVYPREEEEVKAERRALLSSRPHVVVRNAIQKVHSGA